MDTGVAESTQFAKASHQLLTSQSMQPGLTKEVEPVTIELQGAGKHITGAATMDGTPNAMTSTSYAD